ncbi:lysophospholipid acyltransferase family protein [Chitinimonas sp. BJYL2]|uniref:lysophospholipid acyltransferase family protein n=1 Tax=Chitinimonas sp. BJYL2 TaxID=2976696 RepID=UPI0022B52AA5|nr:lysophospholipid acyltransferase family protein [Chitinimonas sp. BJYL2]
MIRLLAGLMWLFRWLPFRVVYVLGSGLGNLLYLLAHERRRVGQTNLRLCFPDMPEAKRNQVLREHFRAMARTILEYGYSWFASPDWLRKHVHLEGLEHLQAQEGKPVILFSGHFAALELCGMRMALETRVVDIYSRQKSAALDAWMHNRRSRLGNGLLLSRQAGIRPVLKALKEGWRLYYFPDQDFGPRDAEFIPFFGVPAATITGLSRLAKASGAVVLPCFASRNPSGIVFRIEAPLADFPGDDPIADTRRTVALLEARIMDALPQYFWLHKRFKTRPEGEAGFYDKV